MANAAASLDINAGLLIKNKIFFGASVRPNAIIAILEFNLTKNLRMGVGYDVDRSEVGKSSTGSFEIFLGYDLGLFKSKVISPRYF